MKPPSRAAACAAALSLALATWSCGTDGQPTTQQPDAGTVDRPDAGGGTVVSAPDNQAQHFVSTDPRYSPTWTFNLRDQVAVPVGVREVYVEVHGCRQSYAPPGAIRYRTPQAPSWRELSVDKPLCGEPAEPSQQVWLPVGEPAQLVVDAVQPSVGVDSYVLTTVKVLGWRLP